MPVPTEPSELVTIVTSLVYAGAALTKAVPALVSEWRFRRIEKWATEKTAGGAFAAELLPILRLSRERRRGGQAAWVKGAYWLNLVAHIWRLVVSWRHKNQGP